MENQTIINLPNTSPNNQSPVPQQIKINSLIPMLFVILSSAAIFGFGGYYLGNQQKNNSALQDINSDVPVVSSNPTATPVASIEATYTYNTFSISYPKTWQVYDSTTDKDFFSADQWKNFDHVVALQNGTSYLVIGIDTKTKDVGVGGIFPSESYRKEYLKDFDEITIGQDKFFLRKYDNPLSMLAEPLGEGGGIYTFASLSKYIPNKITNEKKQTFNGYEDYIHTQNGSAYMIFKFSVNNNIITPTIIQTEFKKVLETIHW